MLAAIILCPAEPATYPVLSRAARGGKTLPAREAVVESAFSLLPLSASLPPSYNVTLVQVRIRKGDLRQFGLDVPARDSRELAQVEFVVGEDGLARAIRFIQPPSRREGDLR